MSSCCCDFVCLASLHCQSAEDTLIRLSQAQLLTVWTLGHGAYLIWPYSGLAMMAVVKSPSSLSRATWKTPSTSCPLATCTVDWHHGAAEATLALHGKHATAVNCLLNRSANSGAFPHGRIRCTE